MLLRSIQKNPAFCSAFSRFRHYFAGNFKKASQKLFIKNYVNIGRKISYGGNNLHKVRKIYLCFLLGRKNLCFLSCFKHGDKIHRLAGGKHTHHFRKKGAVLWAIKAFGAKTLHKLRKAARLYKHGAKNALLRLKAIGHLYAKQHIILFCQKITSYVFAVFVYMRTLIPLQARRFLRKRRFRT